MRLLLIAILIWAATIRPAAAEVLRPQLDDMVAHFADVVFGVEYATLTTKPDVVAKWQGPVVGINVQGRDTPHLIKLASKHIHGLAKLTGLQFRTLKATDTIPSIDLVFLKRAEMGGIKGSGVDANIVKSMVSDFSMACFFLTWRSPPERIVKAMVVVDVEKDPVRIDACLLEELTQVMGLPNDVQTYWPSMFNPLDTSTERSEWDALYIKTLYDPRIEAGMTPGETLVQVRLIFAEALSKMP